MDDNWAAIIVSTITASFGFAGILVVQFAARSKAKKIVPNEKDIMIASEGIERLPRLDYLAKIGNDIKEMRREDRDAHHDIKEMLRDISRDVKDGVRDLRLDIDRLDR